MAKNKTKTKNRTIQNPKPNKASIFLCCFGPPPENSNKASITESSSTTTTKLGSDPPIIIQQHKRGTSSWLSWVRIRIQKNPASKTVPLEAHYSKAKSKSKSILHHKSQAPATISPRPTQTLPVHPATPYYTPTQTRHGASNNVEDTHQQGIGPPPTHQVKRRARRVSSSSSSSMQPPETTSRKHRNARGSSSSSSSLHDAVAGMSVVVVILVIMIFWGRICAILCTSAWLYCIPRFRKNDDYQNEKTKNDVVVVDLDSEEYKKRVVMEGLLERNNNHHRG